MSSLPLVSSTLSKGAADTGCGILQIYSSMQSVVKSHLDAIPEDRKAIEKGGGNAVQKLHEVEKYIRKNKLKVSCPPVTLTPLQCDVLTFTPLH